MVLTILADGGSGRPCQVTAGNKEKYLGDAEASEFLQWGEKRRMTGNREEVDGRDDDREAERGRQKQIFVRAEFVLC